MQVILLIIAVSVDVFVACVACGSEQIKIGSAAALCISTVCSGILGISLYAGMALQGVLLKKYALYLSFFGTSLQWEFFKLTEYAIRKYIERHKFHLQESQNLFFTAQFYSEYLQQSGNGRPRSLGDDVVCGGCIFLHLQCHWTGCLEDLVQDLPERIFYFTVMGSFVVQFLCRTLRMQDWHAGIESRWKDRVYSWVLAGVFVCNTCVSRRFI